MSSALALNHFIQNADGVSWTVLSLLLIGSLTSWYLIVLKSVSAWRQRRASQIFRARFWQANTLEAVAQHIHQHGVTDPFSHLVHHGFSAMETLRAGKTSGLIAQATPDDFLVRALKRAIEQDKRRLDYGQAWLASVASSAPFVGLFGTVWGIYHALNAIAQNGQNTLQSVAGPVGEALIMTGLGLAVAIPAALAYNACAHHARNTLSALNSFAHDVHSLLSIGVKTDRLLSDVRATSKQVLAHAQHA